MKLLPAKADDALRKMIEIVHALRTITENETRHIAVRNEVAMAMTDDDKDKLLAMYTQAVQEFRVRKEEFRGADRSLVEKLEAEQLALSDVAKDNNAMLDALKIPE